MDHTHHPEHTGTTHDMDMDMGDHGGMKMYFHFSEHCTILFKGWHTMNAAELFGSCVGLFVLAILYEGLKAGREKLLQKSTIFVRNNTVSFSSDTKLTEASYNTGQVSMCSVMHLVQSLLHIVQVVVSYFLMLAFMTFNGYVCIAIGLGAGVGYFLFGWNRAVVVDINEHCH